MCGCGFDWVCVWGVEWIMGMLFVVVVVSVNDNGIHGEFILLKLLEFWS